ncbi:MAG: hypothetical protein RLZZ214_501, partial [Verrucomicrobiota bacterium]
PDSPPVPPALARDYERLESLRETAQSRFFLPPAS